ncbi:MAG: molybdopterin-binding oxidoreductase [Frankiales bacterium]|nr:molybdopterin-binding oxidoreductase [Frankiales bacterium]
MTSAPRRFALGALLGLLSAGVAIGVGEVIAAFVRPAASPIIVVGNRMIVLTPEPVKRWAIHEFGTHDKSVLLTGIYLVIALLAVLVGLLALRRRTFGLVGIALFGAFGGYCAVTANAHRGSDVVPTLLGTVAGLVTLYQLFGSLNPAGAEAAAVTVGRPALLADRRKFLQGTAVATGVTVVGGFGGRALQHNRYDASAARAAVRLPAPSSAPEASTASAYDFGKSPIPFQTPEASFYRIDTALSVPQLNPKTWKLRIHGMVDRELVLTYDQLLARPQVERWITLACVSNYVGGYLVSNAKFQGVLLADLLREVGIGPGADQLIASSSDGMTIGSPTAVVMDGRDAMLAIGMNGAPLPIEHGFPVRMVVPGLYGYVSACKWIVDIEATTFARERAYWVQGGWAAKGPVRLASRIDTPLGSTTVKAGSTVPVAGVAWDQHVGVSAVQVRVDQGGWQDAKLAGVPSTDTWRQWLWPWTVPDAGVHTLTVRAFDAKGDLQTADQADPFPAGATGLHTITVQSR